LPEISRESAEEPMRLLADDLGIKAGQLFGILRLAVTGQTVSPPLFESMQVIGKEKVMRRLQSAVAALDRLELGEDR
jgi:glutamyl-tRNA synthetase